MTGRITALVMHLRRAALGQFALVIADGVALGLVITTTGAVCLADLFAYGQCAMWRSLDRP